MDLKIKKTWIKALLSGDYKKAKGALKTERGYCCLGVLTDLYLKKNGSAKSKKLWQEEGRCGNESGVLAKTVMKWAGLSNYSPDIQYGGACVPISCLNDGTTYSGNALSFRKIADLIEAQL